MAWEIECTDTFGGEANYCWVRREIIPYKKGESQAGTMRRAKAAIGLSGSRGRSNRYGDGWEFRPYRSCTVLFVLWTDQEPGDSSQ